MRDNTDHLLSNTNDIRSDVHEMHQELSGLNQTLKELPGQIYQVEKVAHDSFVLGATEFGIGGLLIGLILGLFLGGTKHHHI